MSSNSPSGGMKEMVRSLSNLPSLTHWWNWQSSSSTAPCSIDPGACALPLFTTLSDFVAGL